MLIVLVDHPSEAEIHQYGITRGPAWGILFDEFRAQGIDRTDVKVIYLTKRVLNDKVYTDAKLKKPKPGTSNWKGLFVPDYIKQGWAQVENILKDVPRNSSIMCLGDFCLHALTGKFSVARSRGGWLESFPKQWMVFPSYAPSTIMAMYSLHICFKRDCKVFALTHQAPRIPEKDFIVEVPRRKDKIIELIDSLDPDIITLDIETFQYKISVFGFSIDGNKAIVIPFCEVQKTSTGWQTRDIFKPQDEWEIILSLRKMMQRAKGFCGQNLAFDFQYLFREWLYMPRRDQRIFDTMVQAHVINPTTQKSLDYLASVYLDDYRQWKDDKYTVEGGKDLAFAGDEKLWEYNGTDVIMTHRLRMVFVSLLETEGLQTVADQQEKSIYPLLRMMNRGNQIDIRERTRILSDIESRLVQYREYIKAICGFELNPKSPKQLNDFFYTQLKLPEQLNKKTKKKSTDFDSLEKLEKLEPIIIPLTKRINAIRSLQNLHSMANMQLSIHDRAHTTYNPAGTDTYRLSSSASALDEGANLQNITGGNEEPDQVFEWTPNLKKMFVADEGWTLFEGDLAGADAQVVAWESNDESLKEAFRSRLDVHLFNANEAYELGIPLEHLKQSHPEFKNLKKKYDSQRQRMKIGVHSTNYDVSPKTLAGAMGVTVKAAEAFQSRWFEIHPNIKTWQARARKSLSLTRYIKNAFGYRYYWSDRLDFHSEKTVLAWSPQSTVAIVTQKTMIALDQLPYEHFRLCLQVHDSLVFQIRNDMISHYLPIVKTLAKIEIPYPNDTLVIPFEVVRYRSWGEKEPNG